MIITAVNNFCTENTKLFLKLNFLLESLQFLHSTEVKFICKACFLFYYPLLIYFCLFYHVDSLFDSVNNPKNA